MSDNRRKAIKAGACNAAAECYQRKLTRKASCFVSTVDGCPSLCKAMKPDVWDGCRGERWDDKANRLSTLRRRTLEKVIKVAP